ncbi:MAG: AAA family ATPase [Deltaproteobacteria bacterium]|nr:AAA family ATPase [Deltaproteobacteria bacterium]
MIIRKVKLKNWRNFRSVSFDLKSTTYVLGPNASGKSNLLDVFRFLRDVCNPRGGGLQTAVDRRGGIKNLRCLHARRDTEVVCEFYFSDDFNESITWNYILGFKPEGKGAQRLLVSTERVVKGTQTILDRPNDADKKDPYQLTETHLEQARSNREFREISDVFRKTVYLHLVPQLLKYDSLSSSASVEDDPFGFRFLEIIAATPTRTRDSRLKKIQNALKDAVPNFEQIVFEKDENTGKPHLKGRYSHHRPNGAWQREDQFSDGTLRLIGILWSLLDGEGLLLVEEPELSLNSEVVKQIPILIEQIQKQRKKKRRQVILSTHSESLLTNPGIDSEGIVILEPTTDGTTIRTVSPPEKAAIESGISVAEVILPKMAPSNAGQMRLL